MTPARITWLSSEQPPEAFPDVGQAMTEPNGLLAAGGDLSRQRLLHAYRSGIFPWYEEGQPILWWSPDPRCVLRPENFHLARRLRRSLRSEPCRVSFNADFAAVMAGCARRRRGQRGTWITADMKRAYLDLHDGGWAHSVEVWRRDELVGGLYGLALGEAFFGESMFSAEADGSKVALLALSRVLRSSGYRIIDCQVASPHLMTLGAELMPRARFVHLLGEICASGGQAKHWPAGQIDAQRLIPIPADAALQ